MDDNNREYTNGEVTVYWRPAECIHATTCFSELIEVFNPSKRPWVNMQGATTEEIVKVVKKCPTNALSFSYNKDIKEEQKESVTPKSIEPAVDQTSSEPAKIQIMPNGPALISGNFTVIDVNGQEMKKAQMISLCRCGHSKAMPHCDGSHREIDFKYE